MSHSVIGICTMFYRKKLRLLRSLVINKLRPSVPFLRIIPTDFCNLNCAYCWQHNANRHNMDFKLFDACLKKAIDLDVGLISFLGGEPTLWPPILEAISACTAQAIYTDITTNGIKLTPNYLSSLAGAGLNLLNISVDGLERTKTSKKACLSNSNLVESIAQTLHDSPMRIRVNSVICKDNWTFIKNLIQLAGEINLPISLGFAMYRSPDEFDPRIHFGADDGESISDICAFIKSAKQSGVKIIDPMEYFESYQKFLRGEVFWRCNYATPKGWINIDPYGDIRGCTKKFNRINYNFPAIQRTDIPHLRAELAASVVACNRSCYSNCAFDGAYFAKHKIQLLRSGIV